MATRTEAVLQALADRLAGALGGAEVVRNVAVPTSVPAAGLVIVRDGTAEVEDQLGRDGPWYVARQVELDLVVQHRTAAERDQALDQLLAAVVARLDGDPTLGGLAYGLQAEPPERFTEPVDGGQALKAAELIVSVEYQSPTRV